MRKSWYAFVWLALAILPFAFGSSAAAAIPTSYPIGTGPANVSYGADGKLVYTYENNGDTIPDFSHAGYRMATVPIPNVPVVTTLTPASGDNSALIQAAIDQVSAMPLTNGFRGAVLLTKGIYGMSNGLVIKASGVVLRGEGSGTSGTILRHIATGTGDTITIQNADGSSRSEVPNTRHEIITTYVPLSATWFELDSTANLAVGDNIIVNRRATTEWLAAINQTNWGPSEFTMGWDRTITEIDGNRIRIDVPLMQSIDRQNNYGGGYVSKYSWPGRTQNSGVENLRADSLLDVDTDNNSGGSYSNFGPTFDEYSATVAYTEVNLGPWVVSTSDKLVGFHVTGKNASSSSYVVAIDYIKLVPQ